ncbi:D-alanyl-D-alanine carboxypeptidase [Scopulibacillus daqui]|uniref:D-alanyl-D-alanine carboxypeptidase n=1 Tax=Scopulibacillus daqui TaxID=1469162 RepID=A0ABS2Q3Z6_9BACL|nr:VanY-A/VanY-F/VanY-M family D-Ala-D-Ala carboxypeptidase [Scopulibacillus daqui]MBM7647015.1 D-alanyl-D-alanine carboxypeptidase [Scopulibacillus daqui]
MKKWGFYVIILLISGIYIALLFPQKIGGVKEEQAFHKSTGSIEITKDMVYQGNLVLVNKKYPVHPEGIKSDIVYLRQHNELVNGYGLLDTNIRLSKGVAQKFSEMLDHAKKEGVRHFLINSGYRDFKEQNKLFGQMGSSYALPAGYSEHNLGLSLDVGSTLTKMNRAPEGKWLKENAWKYGFVLRYPEDKTAITGIQYEPWHIRYVGLPHSIIMHEKNLALEEYLKYLKEKKNISIRFNGIKAAVSYYPVSHNMTINVPKQYYYEISGDNVDGVIVTVFS